MHKVTQSDFFSKLDQFSGFAIVNLLWVISSLFIVTIPMATVGLFAVMTDWVRGKNSETLGRFFGAIRQYGWKGFLIGLFDLLLLGLIVINLDLLPHLGLPTPIHYPFLAITLFVSLVVIAGNLYIWTLLVSYDLELKRLIEVSLKLTFAHFGWSVSLLAMTGLVLVLGAALLPALISILVLFSSCAYLVTWGSWRVIRLYDEELRQMSTQERSFAL